MHLLGSTAGDWAVGKADDAKREVESLRERIAMFEKDLESLRLEVQALRNRTVRLK